MCRESTWKPVEGKGTVHSYSEVHHAILASLDLASIDGHRAARIDIRPAAVASHRLEIGLAPVRRQQNARQRPRIFVNVGVLGPRHEIQVAECGSHSAGIR